MNVQRKITPEPHTKTLRGMIVSGGRLQIPAEVRRELGLKDGDGVRMQVIDGQLRIRSFKAVLKEVQDALLAEITPGLLLSDELIADRRAEAERE